MASSTRSDASLSELQTRLNAQRDAIKSGYPSAVIETSKRLAAFSLLDMARIRTKDGDWARAVDLYNQSLQLEDRPDTRSELSVALRNFQLAGTTLQSAPKLQPKNPASDSTSADPRGKHVSLHEKQLSQILGTSFNDWGTAEARQEQDENALRHFQAAEQWDATIPHLMANLGMVAFRAGNFSESGRAFSAIVQADPKDTKSRLFLAMSLFSSDKFVEAAKQFSLISDLALGDPRTAYAMAYSLARSNQQARANELLDQLTAKDMPADVLNLLCQIYNTTENYEHSAACFRRVYQEAPSTPRAHYQVALDLIRLDRPTEAIPELRFEQQANPNDPDVQYQLAYALLETSHKDEAVILLRRVIAAQPDHAQAHYELAKVLLESGEVTGAIQHLEIAAHNDPSKDYIHYQLQAAYRKAGRVEDADRELAIYRTIKAKHREAAPTSAH